MKLFSKDWWSQQLYKEQILELDELQINNPNNITAEKVQKYYEYNINNNDKEFTGYSEGWKEYLALRYKYTKNKANNAIFTQFLIDMMSQSELNSFYHEMRQLVKKWVGKEILNELEINKPLTFKINFPDNMENNSINNKKELLSILNEFIILNPNLCKYMDVGYALQVEEEIKEENTSYPLTIRLAIWCFIVDALYYKIQFQGDIFSITWNNFITKQFNKGIIDINEIEKKFNVNFQKLNELEIEKKEIPIIPFTLKEFNHLKEVIKKVFSNRLLPIKPGNEDYGTKATYFDYGSLYNDYISFWCKIENFSDSDKILLEKIVKRFTKGHNFRGIIHINKHDNDTISVGISHHVITAGGGRLKENKENNNLHLFKEFIKICCNELNIKEGDLNIKLSKDKSSTSTFAHFDPNKPEIVVYIKNRNILDSMRSLAHELKHYQQFINNELTDTSGEDGSEHENEANSFAGIVLRKFGRNHPELYTHLVENKQSLNELQINNPRKPKVGKIYDIKVWWTGDNWKENKYKQKIYEPADETVGGEEGWYWSNGWKCVSIPNSDDIAFEDYVSGERIPYNEDEEIRLSILSELQINKPKQYIPIVKIKTKDNNLINDIYQVNKLINYFENINLKLQQAIGKFDITGRNEFKSGLNLPKNTDELSKLILHAWLFNNMSNYYNYHKGIFDKWWDESRICLEDIQNKDINELQINNPNITAEKVQRYFDDNIWHNDKEFHSSNDGWLEYIKLCKPYIEKHWDIWGYLCTLKDFEKLSQLDLIQIYNEMRQLVKKHVGKEILNELQINKPSRTWDLDVRGVKFENIKIGDVILFTIPGWEGKCAQKVIDCDVMLKSMDIDDEGNIKYNTIDYWSKNSIETWYKKNDLNELQINNPRITVEKVENYFLNNIDKYDVGSNEWEKYEQLCKPYCEKYKIERWLDDNDFIKLSQHDLTKFFIEMCKLFQTFGRQERLDEGIYGDYLFGDKKSGAEFYGGHKETDVNKETNLFKQLKKYVSGYKKEYSEIDLSNLVTLFHKLRQEYPEIVDPKLNKEAYIYRGTYITQEQLDKYSEHKTPTEYDQGYVINDINYNSRRKVQSWSTNYYNAATFAAARHNEGIPVIIRVKVKDADLFWNPHFINLINGYKEDEVLNVKLPLKADLMVINLDTFEDEETFELSKHINIPNE